MGAHTVIAYSYCSGGGEWQFDRPAGRVSVRIRPSVYTNSGETCRATALADEGVILQPGFLVADDLAAGTLVELMPAYRSVTLGIYALYPTRKFVPPKVRALVDFLAECFAAPPPGW